MRGAWPPFHWLQPRIVLPIHNKLRRRPQTARGGRWQQHMTRPRLTSLPERRIRKHSCRRRPRSQLSRGRHRQHHRHVTALKDAQTHTETIPKNTPPRSLKPLPQSLRSKFLPLLSPPPIIFESSVAQHKRKGHAERRGAEEEMRWWKGGAAVANPNWGDQLSGWVCALCAMMQRSEARRGEGEDEGGLS